MHRCIYLLDASKCIDGVSQRVLITIHCLHPRGALASPQSAAAVAGITALVVESNHDDNQRKMQRRREFWLSRASRRSPAVFLATATAFVVHACALHVVMSSPPAAGGSSPGAASATTAPSISTTAGAVSSVSSSDSAAKGVIDG